MWNIGGIHPRRGQLPVSANLLSYGDSFEGRFGDEGAAASGRGLVPGSGGGRHPQLGLDVILRRAARAFGAVASERVSGFGKDWPFLISRNGLACSKIASDESERL